MRALEQVPGAVFRRRLANGREAVTGFIRQLLESRRQELLVTDLDLAPDGRIALELRQSDRVQFVAKPRLGDRQVSLQSRFSF